MKYKVGDKVIPKKFESNDYVPFIKSMEEFIGNEQIITGGCNSYYILSCGFAWLEESLELVEEKVIEQTGEYFYIGQTVYSPYFKNEERKGLVNRIIITNDYPVKCSCVEGNFMFTLDGKYHLKHNFDSLFQESIIFPTNKPIVTFKRGEVVEISDNGNVWWLAFYFKPSDNEEQPYSVFLQKKGDDFDKLRNCKKIRKVKTL